MSDVGAHAAFATGTPLLDSSVYTVYPNPIYSANEIILGRSSEGCVTPASCGNGFNTLLVSPRLARPYSPTILNCPRGSRGRGQLFAEKNSAAGARPRRYRARSGTRNSNFSAHIAF